MEIVGYGDGSGDDYGYGEGSGDGFGSGYGDGDAYIVLHIPGSAPWDAWHVLGPNMTLRDGRTAHVGEVFHEPKIKMCSRGLHASLCPQDAYSYREFGVLTRVKIWGGVIVGKDKLVATHRKIVAIEEAGDE